MNRLRGDLVRPDPCLQALAIEVAGGDLENGPLSLVRRCLEPTAVQPEEDDHGRVPDTVARRLTPVAEVADSGALPTLLHHKAVEEQHLSEAEVSH